MHTTLLRLATLLGRSEHNLASLTLNYTPAVHQHVALKRTIRTLTPEAVEILHGCLETTEMDVLCDLHGEYSNETPLNCVTAYIHFCVKNIIPFREVHCFPNSKPLITTELNELLNKRSKWHGWHKTGTVLKVKITECKNAKKKKKNWKLRCSFSRLGQWTEAIIQPNQNGDSSCLSFTYATIWDLWILQWDSSTWAREKVRYPQSGKHLVLFQFWRKHVINQWLQATYLNVAHYKDTGEIASCPSQFIYYSIQVARSTPRNQTGLDMY